MPKLTTIQKLDEILKFVSDNEDLQDLTTGVVANYLKTIDADEKLDFKTPRLLSRLKEDGYIITNPNISLTTNGYIFQKYNGYSGAIKKYQSDLEETETEKTRRKDIDDKLVTNTARLNRLTLWLAILTGGLFLIEVIKLLIEYIPCHVSK